MSINFCFISLVQFLFIFKNYKIFKYRKKEVLNFSFKMQWLKKIIYFTSCLKFQNLIFIEKNDANYIKFDIIFPRPRIFQKFEKKNLNSCRNYQINNWLCKIEFFEKFLIFFTFYIFIIIFYFYYFLFYLLFLYFSISLFQNIKNININ